MNHPHVDLNELKQTLQDPTQSMAKRFRALFSLKSLMQEPTAQGFLIDLIGQVLFKDPSALLKHELCYVLGQIKNREAITVLTQVLQKETEDAMVRHEAAEALGAIGDAQVIPLLEAYMNDKNPVIQQTCELAISSLRHEGLQQPTASKFTSIDPAPAFDAVNVDDLERILLDTCRPLFERYQAMFALRNINSERAVLSLAKGFSDSDSALFRHEIAFVFGQLMHPASVPSLVQVLRDSSEEPMVRHEAAEALGAIGSPECLAVLKDYVRDGSDVVRESCEVGLDML